MIRRDALRALSLFGAAPLAFGKGKPPPKQPPPPAPVPSVTITLVPTGGDDTAQIMNALASLPSWGGEIILNGAVFSVPNGITEAAPGLILRGIGHRVQGPGDAGLTTGTIVRSTYAGFTWTRTNPLATANEYRGALFDGITFTGSGAGGMLLQSCYNTIVDCSAIGYTSGRGFYVLAPNIAGGSAQENAFVDCGAQNCLTGVESASNDQSEIRGFITLKTAAGGIHGQGYGIVLRDASRVMGGKVEGNATGILVAGSPVQIIGVGSEDNANFDIDLDRGTTSQSFTSNLVVGAFGTVRVGPWNFGDTVIGGYYPRLLTDVPNPQGIAKHTATLGAWNV